MYRLRTSGCPLELIDQIGGWSSIGTIGSKYGQGYELDAVRDQLNKNFVGFSTFTKDHPDASTGTMVRSASGCR